MNKKSSKGISLISLIITIIVIIILAAIVIFSGMGTPEKAQLSAVISDIDNVQTAVDQAYYGFYTERSVAGEVWTKSQFYEAVATGETNRDNLSGTGIVPISDSSMVKMTLPKYEGRTWGVAVEDIDDHMQVGSVVLLPGYETDGKIYATLLDVQNDGRDTTSMELAMGKVKDENSDTAGCMELSYEGGYVKVRVTNEKLKKAIVKYAKEHPEETGITEPFNTFEELCSLIGGEPEYFLEEIMYETSASIEASMTNVSSTYFIKSDNEFIVYGIPRSVGEVTASTFLGETKSINIIKLDTNLAVLKSTSTIDLTYQYGYVIAKIPSDENLKKAIVNMVRYDIDIVNDIGIIDTYEEFCSKTGENPDEFLTSLKEEIKNSLNNNDFSCRDTGEEFVGYLIPNQVGEQGIECSVGEYGTLDNSIFIPKLDEYMIRIVYGYARLCKYNGEYYEAVYEEYNIILKINGEEKYNGSSSGYEPYIFEYFPIHKAIVNLDVTATIDGKNVYYKGMVVVIRPK